MKPDSVDEVAGHTTLYAADAILSTASMVSPGVRSLAPASPPLRMTGLFSAAKLPTFAYWEER